MTAAPTQAIQRRLPLTVKLHCPMMDIRAVRGTLRDLDEDDILELISAKALRWAFDLRSNQANRAEVRVFAPCVEEYQSKADSRELKAEREFSTIDQVIDWIFPFKRPALKATELKRQWNTGSTHIHNLIRDGLLQAVPGTGDKVNQTPTVLRASAVEFLKARQM